MLGLFGEVKLTETVNDWSEFICEEMLEMVNEEVEEVDESDEEEDEDGVGVEVGNEDELTVKVTSLSAQYALPAVVNRFNLNVYMPSPENKLLLLSIFIFTVPFQFPLWSVIIDLRVVKLLAVYLTQEESFQVNPK